MAPSIAVGVIDNASQDATLAEVQARALTRPGLRLIANRENRGFAAAVNQGVQAMDATEYLLLNPDAYLRTGIQPLVEAARAYGLASGKLVDKTGEPQKGFTIRRFPTPLMIWFEILGWNRLWPSNPVNRRYRYLDRDLEVSGPVEQPAGAFLMFRKDVWERLGGFDERFFPIWFEDVDFCVRASQLGYPPYYQPSVAAEHDGGHSISRMGVVSRDRYWCASLLRYAAKHFPSSVYRGICAAVLLTSLPRAVAGMIRERSSSPILSCIHVVAISGRRLVSRREARGDSERFL